MSARWARPLGPAPMMGGKRVDTNRKVAVVAGVLFIIATVGALASTALLTPILSAPDYLTKISANENQVLWGAFLQFIGGAACPAIAIVLYPVLRRHNEGLALGSVGFRLIEGALYVVIVVVLLLLVTLSREAVVAGAPTPSAFQLPGVLLMAGRDWLGPVAAVLTFGLGALMYYWVFYRSRLVPRWLSAWGLVGVTLLIVSATLVLFRVAAPLGTTQTVLALPIAVQEMVLAVWLIAKGFNRSAIAPGSAGETSRWRAAVSTASSSAA
jgi:hypothetical protein